MDWIQHISLIIQLIVEPVAIDTISLRSRSTQSLDMALFSQRCINESKSLSSIVVESTSLYSFKSNLFKFGSSRKDKCDGLNWPSILIR